VRLRLRALNVNTLKRKFNKEVKLQYILKGRMLRNIKPCFVIVRVWGKVLNKKAMRVQEKLLFD